MMRRPIHSGWYSFFIFFIMFNVSSCKKNTEEQNDAQESYTVGFKFQEFEQDASPLGAKRAASSKRYAVVNTTTENMYEGHIYYWSFNTETLMPDIYPSTHWRITYNGGQIPDEYGIGWAYEDHTAGRALSLKGLKELIFKMPLTNVLALHELAFDVSSSGTGPKSFSLSFSQNGDDYTALQENNQFTNTNTPQAKNTFTFALAEQSLDFSRDLYIKLTPKAGNRGSAGDYNEVTGIMRVDNFRLSGIAERVADANVRRIHYHIFDAITKNVILSGADHFREGALSDFALTLPGGDYIASFVTNVSNAELDIPEIGGASDYFVANTFSNSKAEIFGVLDTFTVQGDMQKDIALNRYYSEIRFAFTDPGDLSGVAKLIVKRTHEANFYAPFNPIMNNPIEDTSEIVLLPEFDETNREIYFNQFIGHTSIPLPLGYRVDVYDASDEWIRTFQVESEIRNNMQLLFRGKLLDAPNGQFVVRLNEKWDGEQQVDFN
ncbi:hypothetical protein [Sphingobacterium arenae]|uniref:F5/8 type C domain-containing protein n=1 Tax=Sphingobacterium arenae TaxID=1280598 RepID=A0ABR7XZQ0_9SPHI|nr:hypothetical protein [Sphingobacterium arenae]MBD1424535.1 hypothetical protein [Sphingobacterium arenae]